MNNIWFFIPFAILIVGVVIWGLCVTFVGIFKYHNKYYGLGVAVFTIVGIVSIALAIIGLFMQRFLIFIYVDLTVSVFPLNNC